MALPNSLSSVTPAGSDSPSLGDDVFRSKSLALLDILGIPDATSITQAAFDIDAGGLAQAIFYDAAATPASGELGRNGSTLYYRITSNHTNSVLDVLGLIGDTSGTPAAGIGTGILLQSESEDEAPSDILRLAGVFSDRATGSEDSYFSVYLRVGGRALDEKYRYTSTAGDGFTAIFAHAASADRTFTLPDVSGTVVVDGSLASGVAERTAGDVTTTSTSLVDLTGASITITTGARRVLLGFQGGWLNDGANINFATWDVDGTNQAGTGEWTGISGANQGLLNLSWVTDVLTAASHTFKLRWRVNAGTGTVEASSTRKYRMWAIEQPITA